MFTVTCACGRKHAARPELAGKYIKCPACGRALQIPRETDDIKILEIAGTGRKEVIPCERHPNNRSIGTCTVCRAPICSECRDEFGYYCSTEHKSMELSGDAPRAFPMARVTGRDRAAVERSRKLLRVATRSLFAAAALLVLYVGGRWILDKGGRTRWEADLERETPALLLASGEGIRVVTADGRFVMFDDDGSKTGSRETGVKAEGSAFAGVVEDIVIVSDGKSTTGLSVRDGRVAWTYPAASRSKVLVDGGRIFLARQELTPEQAQALKKTKIIQVRNNRFAQKPDEIEVPDIDEKYRHLVGTLTHIVALDAATGREAWKVPLEKPVRLITLLAGFGHLWSREDSWLEQETAVTGTIHSGKDGRALWKLPDGVAGPLFTPRGLVVATVSGLQCLAYDDGSPAWSVPMDLGHIKKNRSFEHAEARVKGLWMRDGAVLLHMGRVLTCVDPADGKVRWNIDTGGWIEETAMAGGVLICSGYSTAAPSVPLAIGSDKMQEILTAEMPEWGSMAPFTAGHDLRNGVRLWTLPMSGDFLPTDCGIVLSSSLSRPDLFARTGGSPYSSEAQVKFVDASSGNVLWEFRAPGYVTRVEPLGDTLFVALAIRTEGARADLTRYDPKPEKSRLISLWLR